MKDFFHLSNELKPIYETPWVVNDDRLNYLMVIAAEEEETSSIHLGETVNTLEPVDNH